MEKFKITYQFGNKNAHRLQSVTQLLQHLGFKKYRKIEPTLGRGIVLEGFDDARDFVVISYASRNRVCVHY